MVRNMMMILMIMMETMMTGSQGAVEHYLECNDQPSTLCLIQGYSKFELPLTKSPNMIKIGEKNIFRRQMQRFS